MNSDWFESLTDHDPQRISDRVENIPCCILTMEKWRYLYTVVQEVKSVLNDFPTGVLGPSAQKWKTHTGTQVLAQRIRGYIESVQGNNRQKRLQWDEVAATSVFRLLQADTTVLRFLTKETQEATDIQLKALTEKLSAAVNAIHDFRVEATKRALASKTEKKRLEQEVIEAWSSLTRALNSAMEAHQHLDVIIRAACSTLGTPGGVVNIVPIEGKPNKFHLTVDDVIQIRGDMPESRNKDILSLNSAFAITAVLRKWKTPVVDTDLVYYPPIGAQLPDDWKHERTSLTTEMCKITESMFRELFDRIKGNKNQQSITSLRSGYRPHPRYRKNQHDM